MFPNSKKWQCLSNEHKAGRQTVRQDAWRHERGYAGGLGVIVGETFSERRLGGQHINHQIYLKFKDMIC